MEEQQGDQESKAAKTENGSGNDNKRGGEEGEEEEEWAKRRQARAEQRRAEREERGVKRGGEEPRAEYQTEVKAQIVEEENEANEDKDETMALLWKSSNRMRWAWQIEGGLSQRWELRKGVVLDLGTRDDNDELWNFDDEDKRSVIGEYVMEHKPLMIIGVMCKRWRKDLARTKLRG